MRGARGVRQEGAREQREKRGSMGEEVYVREKMNIPVKYEDT